MRVTLFLLGLPIVDLTIGRADPFDALLSPGTWDHDDVDVSHILADEED